MMLQMYLYNHKNVTGIQVTQCPPSLKAEIWVILDYDPKLLLRECHVESRPGMLPEVFILLHPPTNKSIDLPQHLYLFFPGTVNQTGKFPACLLGPVSCSFSDILLPSLFLSLPPSLSHPDTLIPPYQIIHVSTQPDLFLKDISWLSQLGQSLFTFCSCFLQNRSLGPLSEFRHLTTPTSCHLFLVVLSVLHSHCSTMQSCQGPRTSGKFSGTSMAITPLDLCSRHHKTLGSLRHSPFSFTGHMPLEFLILSLLPFSPPLVGLLFWSPCSLLFTVPHNLCLFHRLWMDFSAASSIYTALGLLGCPPWNRVINTCVLSSPK